MIVSLEKKNIYENILELIRNSPMVKLNKIPKSEGIKCEIVAKCDFLLPGGSCKDRIAKKMIEDAEKDGTIKKGHTIIVPTSGNFGIGLSMVAAVKGYNVIITLPDKMSQEKEDVLNSLGATVIRCATDKFEDPESIFQYAKKLQKEIPNSVIFDQYSNEGNPSAHYEETAEEIWEQCEGKIDYVVISVGTGGTITGVGKKLKEKDKNIKIIGVDPHGSVIAFPDHLNNQGIHKYSLEGIGEDFIPDICDRETYVDQWIKVHDKESFKMARRIIREEGLLIGGSCGSTLIGALQIAKELSQDKRVVVMFVDGIRNYLTKFLNDDWMLEKGFITQEEYDSLQKTSDNVQPYGEDIKIAELNLPEISPISIDASVSNALKLFENLHIECLPVINFNKKLIGIITSKIIANGLSTFKVDLNDDISKIVSEDYKVLRSNDKVKHLQKGFNRHLFIIVQGNKNKFYICQQKDLLDYFMKHNS